jgi:hypothetical protein
MAWIGAAWLGKVWVLIYIIRMASTNYYKVGYSLESVKNRRASLQTGNPLPLEILGCKEDGTMEDEQALLNELYQYRTAGGTEWFELPDVVVEEVMNTWSFNPIQDELFNVLPDIRHGFMDRKIKKEEGFILPTVVMDRPGSISR